MKKLLMVIIVIVMGFAFVACGSGTEEATEEASSSLTHTDTKAKGQECIYCFGKGEIRCPDCQGIPKFETSDSLCLTCGGAGTIDLINDDGSITKMPCLTCYGEGYLREVCETCRGEGVVPCSRCGGKGVLE